MAKNRYKLSVPSVELGTTGLKDYILLAYVLFYDFVVCNVGVLQVVERKILRRCMYSVFRFFIFIPQRSIIFTRRFHASALFDDAVCITARGIHSCELLKIPKKIFFRSLLWHCMQNGRLPSFELYVYYENNFPLLPETTLFNSFCLHMKNYNMIIHISCSTVYIILLTILYYDMQNNCWGLPEWDARQKNDFCTKRCEELKTCSGTKRFKTITTILFSQGTL